MQAIFDFFGMQQPEKRRPMTTVPEHDSPAEQRAAWNEFVRFLKAKDARITKSRHIVFRHVMSRHDHFRADEVASALAAGSDRVSRGTVYRTLALMSEMGLIRQIRDSDTHVHYEHVYGHPHHEHMICDRCGAFLEFNDEKVDTLLQQACREKKFKQRTHRIVILGLCEKCTRTEAES